MPLQNPALIGAPSPVGRGGVAAGPQLIQRTIIQGNLVSTADTVGTILTPKGATVAKVKAIGGGAPGYQGANGRGGGGGGYAFKRLEGLTVGAPLDYKVAGYSQPSNTAIQAGSTSVSISGQVVCQAAGGRGFSGGGNDTANIGDVKRLGGNGGLGGSYSSTTATGGEFGGAPGQYEYVSNSNNGGPGGGSAGDRDDPFGLWLGCDGAVAPVNKAGQAAPGYGGGGSGGNNPSGASGHGSPGYLVIEFWSA